MANNPRAKQFMPFASLKGYFDLIREEQRVKEPKKSLSEEGATVLSFKLNQVKKGMLVKITYYNVDAYETMEGIVSNFDDTFRNITVVKKMIPFDDILDISGGEISEYEWFYYLKRSNFNKFRYDYYILVQLIQLL